MNENQIAKAVVNVAYQLHTKLGPGLLETVYEVLLAHELRKLGFVVDRQVPIPIIYEGVRFEEGFRADLIVNGIVIVELKSVEGLLPVHSKQVLTQIKLTNRKLGLLINFGEETLKNGIKRLINGTIESDHEATL
jgi:GxxExxY protein